MPPAYGVDVTDTAAGRLDVRRRLGHGSSVRGGGVRSSRSDAAARCLWRDLGSIARRVGRRLVTPRCPAADVVADPGVGSSVPQVNTARGTGDDASDAPGNAGGPYSGPAATASTRIDSADLVLDKTHVDPFVAGATPPGGSRCATPDPTSRSARSGSTDTLPPGVSLVSATGTGWSCAASGADLVCTRLTPTETLAVGASLPVITVVIAIPDDTAPGTTLTNSASVTDRTFDP